MHGSFGMDALVVTGTTISFVYSSIQLTASCLTGVPTMHVFFETSGMLLLFVTMGKYFEAYAKGSTISAMTSLLKLQPRQAVLVTRGAERYLETKDGNNTSANDNSSEKNGGTEKAEDTDDDGDAEETDIIDIDLIQKGSFLSFSITF